MRGSLFLSHPAVDYRLRPSLGHMLLWTALLFLAPAVGTRDLPKAVVSLEPPWINVIREDAVTLKCHGASTPGDHSIQWFHNGSSIPTQVQRRYSFNARNTDSGDYRCQTGQTSLSDPVHLGVFSDWLLLQTSSRVFQEGNPIMLRCHSWKNKPLIKITYFHNKKALKFFQQNLNFSIPHANLSHSGEYYCTGFIGRTSYTSESVAIVIQKSKSSSASVMQIIVALLSGVAFVAIVAAGVAWFRLRRKGTSG
ncbi:PREDICTED: low affinity immunoglobulin gamma Fc region receptor II-b isoform X2 [Condylura cristata]|uniref:low affinity immunoglobulin gamma Fc region receptor II-b isoform X2 n=1 Tax=Condylura cristata TaxID=143302 RepID=UPI000643085D|nr:PREDICTED: low affinity immunoglobulin gamma Fc region receptor II-b isoform X2 [Condylura cristata]